MTARLVLTRPVPERVVVVGCAGSGRRRWRVRSRRDWTRGTSNATRSAMTRLPASLHWSLPPSRPPARDGCSTVRPTKQRRWCAELRSLEGRAAAAGLQGRHAIAWPGVTRLPRQHLRYLALAAGATIIGPGWPPFSKVDLRHAGALRCRPPLPRCTPVLLPSGPCSPTSVTVAAISVRVVCRESSKVTRRSPARRSRRPSSPE